MVAAAKEGARGFLIDGNPKDIHQADFFESIIGSVSGAICLTASDQERTKRLIKRWQGENRLEG